MTLIDTKQIEGLEDFLNSILVSAEQDTDGTVTLTRSNGLFVKFPTGSGRIPTRGETGDKGDTGPDGLSIQELAQDIFGSDWASQTAGEKGETGDRGITGKNGKNGNNFEFENVTVEQGDSFSMTVNNKDLRIIIPLIEKGKKGDPGTEFLIYKCTVEQSDTFEVNTVWEDRYGTIEIKLPPSQKGEDGEDGYYIEGKHEVIGDIIGDILSSDQEWYCKKENYNDIIDYHIGFSAAPRGMKGEQGSKGQDGIVLGSLKMNSNGTSKEGTVKFFTNENGHFVNFKFNNNSYSTLGYDIKDNDIILAHEVHKIKNKSTKTANEILENLRK